jgi:hypothetical protein
MVLFDSAFTTGAGIAALETRLYRTPPPRSLHFIRVQSPFRLLQSAVDFVERGQIGHLFPFLYPALRLSADAGHARRLRLGEPGSSPAADQLAGKRGAGVANGGTLRSGCITRVFTENPDDFIPPRCIADDFD